MKRVLMGLAALAATALVPTTASAQASVDLTLVHGLPGVTADVAVDGTVVIDNFAPGSLANITSFAGQTLNNLTVTDDATGDVVIGPVASIDIPASGSHSIVAHLDASGTPVLNTYENNTAAVSSGEARLTIRHTADAPSIDFIYGGDRVEVAPGASAEVELPAGPVDGQIGLVGDVPIADVPSVDLAATTNTIVHVIGSLDDGTVDFVVQIVDIAAAAGDTTTTDPNATTTTTDPNATTTTSTSTTSTTTTSVAAAPTAVNTGSPLEDNSSFLLVAVALGGLALAGGAMYARRRV